MNPLSRVRPKAVIAFNDITAVFSPRPDLATKIAECIAECAEVEFSLGSALAALFRSDTKTIKTALAIFVDASSRNAQLAMLDAAAKAGLEPNHYEVFRAIMKEAVRPALKERDKLAHWCWGYSPDLPDTLLLMEPTKKVTTFATYFLKPDTPLKIDRDAIYVVTKTDLANIYRRIAAARYLLECFIGAVWRGNSKARRARFLQRLASEPLVRKEVLRSKGRAKSNPKAQRRSRQPSRRARP
jgi:hypothetical protein